MSDSMLFCPACGHDKRMSLEKATFVCEGCGTHVVVGKCLGCDARHTVAEGTDAFECSGCEVITLWPPRVKGFSRVARRIGGRSERAWRTVRSWPVAVRAVLWVVGWGLLLPLAAWASPLRDRAKVGVSVMTTATLVAAIGVGVAALLSAA